MSYLDMVILVAELASFLGCGGAAVFVAAHFGWSLNRSRSCSAERRGQGGAVVALSGAAAAVLWLLVLVPGVRIGLVVQWTTAFLVMVAVVVAGAAFASTLFRAVIGTELGGVIHRRVEQVHRQIIDSAAGRA